MNRLYIVFLVFAFSSVGYGAKDDTVSFFAQFKGSASAKSKDVYDTRSTGRPSRIETKIVNGSPVSKIHTLDGQSLDIKGQAVFVDANRFDYKATVTFSDSAGALYLESTSPGEIVPTENPKLKMGVVILKVVKGEGIFANMTGIATANSVILDETQLEDSYHFRLKTKKKSGVSGKD